MSWGMGFFKLKHFSIPACFFLISTTWVIFPLVAGFVTKIVFFAT